MTVAEMTGLTTPKSHVEAFEAFARGLGGEPAALVARRREAIGRFAELGYPGPRNEDWKFTSLRELTHTPFVLAPYHKAAVTHPVLPAGVLVMRMADAIEKH